MKKRCLIYQRKNLINSSGGVERVVCNLANAMSRGGYSVILLTNENKNGMPFYAVDDAVDFINLGGTKFAGLRYGISKLLISNRVGRFLFKYFTRYDQRLHTASILNDFINQRGVDVVLSCGISELVDLAYQQRLSCPIIQMFHNEPSSYFKSDKQGRRGVIEDVLRQVAVAQVLLEDSLLSLKKYYRGATAVIGNAVEPPPSAGQSVISKKQIVYLARLEPGKRQELLIRAFARIADRHPDWSAHLFGAGKRAYVNQLRRLTRKLRMERRVFFRGVTDNPREELATSEICAFPSRSEGFGMGLAEAMVSGLACIGLKNAAGVNSLMVNGTTGLLVDDTTAAFAQGLESLLNDPELRRRLGDNARAYIQEEYSPACIWNQWDDLLKRVIKQGG